ncbi:MULTISPECIES: hypothetical protein [unclassified Oceanobacter]|uniref:hypothetical protein n=1 Tax=unclassified Oceanobacter TaxID=2620260 RepID=UPI0027347388|nr:MULTISPECIES: hypothetical protein [unclassified Oceanobacter]MDP2506583.1 hypothetical protein [Oceanobacter sp. 3_MG-2023]MDP2548970.1 hypothetical protein [Oceanobacter sp. 4_MG-2023]
MLTGKNNTYFLRQQELRLTAFYCLLMAVCLAALSWIDWRHQHVGETIATLLLGCLLSIYARYLLLHDKPYRRRWPEWLVVTLLVLMALREMTIGLDTVHIGFWVPFYLVFAFRWQYAIWMMLAFSVLFLCLAACLDILLRAQVMTTYTVSVAVAAAIGWMNESGTIRLREEVGADPRTGAYREDQLLIDLAREIPRADRHSSRLLLTLVLVPGTWRQLGNEAFEDRIQQLGTHLQQGVQPFHMLYRLESDDFLVLMPYGTTDDFRLIEQQLDPVARAGEQPLDIVAIHYQPDDDVDSLVVRIREACHDDHA